MQSDSPLSIDTRNGRVQGTVLFHLTGPLTLSNVFAFQDAVRSGELPRLAIVDLSAVPYMDSAGMGALVNYYTHCQRKGASLMVTGVNGRVQELFVLTKVSTIIPQAATVDEAEART
jgi:anti-sigma B factor antagonist